MTTRWAHWAQALGPNPGGGAHTGVRGFSCVEEVSNSPSFSLFPFSAIPLTLFLTNMTKYSDDTRILYPRTNMVRDLIDASETLALTFNALNVMLSKLCKQSARESREQASHDRVGSTR